MKTVKQILSLALCAATLMLGGCSSKPASQTESTTTAPTETIDPNTPLCDGKSLKMLVITSSFGLNTTQFLYDVAKAEGCTDVVIGRLYGSGCTLQMHVDNANTNANYYEYSKIGGGNTRWQTSYAIPLKYGLQDEDWDIIFIQQGAAQAGIADSYADYIDQLMTYVHANKTNPNARFVWNMTWAYQSDSTQPVFVNTFRSNQTDMYNAIVDVVKEKILPRTDFDRIIPSGTVIQNARTSAFGDTLCKDTYHLNNYGGILAAYGVYSVLTGQPLTEIHLDAAAAAPNGIQGADPVTNLSEEDKAIIIESVNNAVNNPFTVTPSVITEG